LSRTDHSGRENGRAPDSAFGVYVVGRPVMLIIWGIALWGTIAAVRLGWIAITQDGSAALRLLLAPAVGLPVLLAVVMWIALAMALSGFFGNREP
jgi:hypothetical protein